jgi:hypothetical protein
VNNGRPAQWLSGGRRFFFGRPPAIGRRGCSCRT